MKQYPFLSLKDVNAPYREEIDNAIADVLDNGWYLNGKYNREVEQQLCRLSHADFAVTCSNGLDALRLIFKALKKLGRLHNGDEVIVQANTYIASVLAISDCGLQPILVDASTSTLNIDSSLVEAAITPLTKAIMPVHLYGSACWDANIADIAQRHNLIVVEDNAQAIGASAVCNGLNGNNITGNLGHAAAFSFYPTKNVGALGDAGAITTCDKMLADTIRALANYGSDRRYHNIHKGLNCRMDELQAAVVAIKLRHLNDITSRRRDNALSYSRFINNTVIEKPYHDPGSVWHQYVIRVKHGLRDAFRDYLSNNGVATDIHYATPPHRQPCYKEFAHLSLPATEKMAFQYVSLPISEVLTSDDIRHISDVINSFVPKNQKSVNKS